MKISPTTAVQPIKPTSKTKDRPSQQSTGNQSQSSSKNNGGSGSKFDRKV